MKNTVRGIGGGNSLQGARDALAQTEQRLIELDGERAQKLADQQRRSLQADWTVHRDAIAALEIKQTKRERARRAEEKAAFVGELKKTLPRRQAAVDRLDAALKEVASAFVDLAAADEAIFANWPEVMPPADRFSYLRAMHIEPLSSMRKQRPLMAGLIRELINRGPFDFAAEVEKRGRELIEELEGSAASAGEAA
jgi:hypothetical protein